MGYNSDVIRLILAAFDWFGVFNSNFWFGNDEETKKRQEDKFKEN